MNKVFVPSFSTDYHREQAARWRIEARAALQALLRTAASAWPNDQR